MSTNVLVTSFHPFPTVALSLPSDTFLFSIPSLLCSHFPSFPEPGDLHISFHSGPAPGSYTTLSDLQTHHVSVRVTPSLRGGKGGFGSQLRAAGGRMSSQKTSNNDSCRDLSGRRLSTVKEAKKLAAYLESEPERKKAAIEARKVKIEALERQLGIEGSSFQGKEGDNSTGTKRRFDDTEYLEQSREIVDSVKSAVAAGLLKKNNNKKAKTSHPPKDGDNLTGTKRRFDDTEYLEQSREIAGSVKSAATAGLLNNKNKNKKAETSHPPNEDTPTAAAL